MCVCLCLCVLMCVCACMHKYAYVCAYVWETPRAGAHACVYVGEADIDIGCCSSWAGNLVFLRRGPSLTWNSLILPELMEYSWGYEKITWKGCRELRCKANNTCITMLTQWRCDLPSWASWVPLHWLSGQALQLQDRSHVSSLGMEISVGKSDI